MQSTEIYSIQHFINHIEKRKEKAIQIKDLLANSYIDNAEEIGKEDLSALIHLINYYKEDAPIGTIMAIGVGQLIDFFLKTNQKSKLERLLDDLGQDISSEILRQKPWIIRYINDDYAKLNTH
jgi:hypothetical protein